MRTIAIIVFTFITVCSIGQVRKTDMATEGKPFVLGVIETLQSEALGEKRTLNIYLPEGYNANDTVRYPVVYLLDGSADEDFIHVVGLYQFNSFPWINRVPPSIIVGIANTDRKRDFTFPSNIPKYQKILPTSGGSAKFIAFIEKELQPYIEKKYKTNASKTIIGESLGGLLATEMLFHHTHLFNRYIIISPSLWWDNESLLNQKQKPLMAGFKEKTDIYIGAGKEGPVMEADTKLLAEKIRNTKSLNVTLYNDYLPHEDHATISHQAILNALRLLSSSTKKKE